MKQKKTIHIIAMATLAAIIFGLAWAEQLTLTSYYPAPYGKYKEFTTTSKTTLATNSELTDPEAKVGIGTDTPTEKLDVSGEIHATGDVCTDQGGGVCLSTAGGGAWQYSGVQILNNVTPPTSWQAIDLSSYVGTNYALVMLKVRVLGGWGNDIRVSVRPNGDGDSYVNGLFLGSGTADARIEKDVDGNDVGLLMIETDNSGKIEWKTISLFVPSVDMWLLGFVR